MPKTATSIQLTEEQIQHLVSIIQKGTIEVRVYKRAKILLLKAQGISNEAIADKLDITVPTVRFCLQKFLEKGIQSALEDATGRGRKAAIPHTEKRSTLKRDYEYKRLGTISLLAAIDLLTGEAIPLVSETHKSSDFVIFLRILDEKYPKGDKLRIILDNHSAHTSEETQRYLNETPDRFEFVFKPTHGSWLNLVEGFFSKMSRQMLDGITLILSFC